ncbi:hypothetical protein BD324DRAFT_630158 [Kockovaella imperatae]|uniref:Oxidoreductase AflY n=1 Tax=Kockovaella imperatae TaxID=4999 RepID=A0A1Y1UDN8_9TREE|nr:hypothetical protein BD324DRAFT_630158 [Kockovaella imperatae]ORX36099.1 hypothetical protein BD324DRAFT_630158 [Kockovaella imperatae]
MLSPLRLAPSSSALTLRHTSLRKMSHSLPIPSMARNFPDSLAGPSSFFSFPGITPESTSTTRRLLEENDRRNDIFGPSRIFHNHFSHGLLTRYALGAPSKMLQGSWEAEQEDFFSLDPTAKGRRASVAKRLPEAISEASWDDPATLGVTDAYPIYLAYFHNEIEKMGSVETFKKYIMTPEANYKGRNGRAAPQMIHRFMSGVLHPFIHAGFGIEFSDRLTLAEGIAQTAINGTSYGELFDADWLKTLETEHKPASSKSILEIYSTFCSDETFKPVPYDPDAMISTRIKRALQHAEKLRELVGSWSLTDQELEGWKGKIQEVDLLATLLACASTRRGYEKKVDFFLMHGLTSSVFVHAFMPVLDIPQRRALLASYILTLLVVSMSRGRAHLDPSWLMEATAFPVGPGSTAKSSKNTIVDPTDNETRNPWTGIIESCLYDWDAHVPKAIRSLVHFANLYGSVPQGGFGMALPADYSMLDGSVFVRAAGVIMDVMGWCREGEKSGGWDRSAMGYDEAWTGVPRRDHA